MLYDDFVGISEFPYNEFGKIKDLKRKRGCRQRKGEKVTYINCISAYDTEVTNYAFYNNDGKPDVNKSFGLQYVWQMHFNWVDESTGEIKDITVIDRNIVGFKIFLNRLSDNIKEGRRLVIYIHNMSYEWQWLKSTLDFDSVFCMDSRKVVKAVSGKFEFRCSYIQSNMGLSLLTDTYNVKHKKLKGEDFDYSKKRHNETPLTKDEYQYCINDVYGLVEAMKKRMESYNDDLYTIPMTSTGYVRREAKECLKIFRHSTFFKDELDSYDTYQMLRRAFRGGDCHASRLYASQIIDNVSSFDRSSSYPDVMVNEEFPMTKFKTYASECYEDTINKLIDNHVPFLCDVTLYNIEIKKDCYDPYIPRDKCNFLYNDVEDSKYFRDSRKKKYKKGDYFYNDNGRVLKAEECSLTICDVDWKIIKECYNYSEVVFTKVKTSKYKKMPEEFRDLVIKYYTQKTELKKAKGPETKEEKEAREELYVKAKNSLNSLFGMLVQRLVIDSYSYDAGSNEIFNVGHQDYKGDELTDEEAYYKEVEKAILFYRIGVYITAYGRYWLHQGIKIVGKDFIYGDTDSVKFIGKHDFSKLNDLLMNRSAESGACATDPSGETHYMGVFEEDGKYERFITLGCKKYSYEAYEYNKETKENDYNFHITISGVPKKEGAEIMKSCDNFKIGYIFHGTGKLMPIYKDFHDYGDVEVTDYLGNTITENVCSNVCLVDVDYKLGTTDEYFDLINDLRNSLTEY